MLRLQKAQADRRFGRREGTEPAWRYSFRGFLGVILGFYRGYVGIIEYILAPFWGFWVLVGLGFGVLVGLGFKGFGGFRVEGSERL